MNAKKKSKLDWFLPAACLLTMAIIVFNILSVLSLLEWHRGKILTVDENQNRVTILTDDGKLTLKYSCKKILIPGASIKFRFNPYNNLLDIWYENEQIILKGGV